jgi:hypothetical protein
MHSLQDMRLDKNVFKCLGNAAYARNLAIEAMCTESVFLITIIANKYFDSSTYTMHHRHRLHT